MRQLFSLVLLVGIECLAGVARGENTAGLVDSFMNSIPYRIAYTRLEKPPRPRFVSGTQFSTLKCSTSCNAVDAKDCYVILKSSLLFDRDVYPYFFPHLGDTLCCSSYSTPQGSQSHFLLTNAPVVPSDSIQRMLEFVIQRYSLAVQKYSFAKDDYEKDKAMMYATVAFYPLAIATTAILMTSSKRDTRQAGYICGGLLGIGLFTDGKSFISWLGLRKEMQRRRDVLEHWNANSTRQILDSLKTP